MKLRNKKTGQEGNFIINKDHFECVDLDYVPEYNSLAELNEEWEDYEEPKEWWFIDCTGSIKHGEGLFTEKSYIKDIQEIGNLFETAEEAEKAVEKLKALKRLKNKGFKFNDFEYTELCDYARVSIKATVINDSIHDDLLLLFGGEE